MIRFQEYLIEAAGKNLHLEHIEDEILNDGINGGRAAINFIQSLRDMLAGSAKTSVKCKYKMGWGSCNICRNRPFRWSVFCCEEIGIQ